MMIVVELRRAEIWRCAAAVSERKRFGSFSPRTSTVLICRFRKFLAGGKIYGAQALILGGDIAGKAIVPLVMNGDKRYWYRFQGEEGMSTTTG